MFRWIITYGWDCDHEVYRAASLDDALTEAVRRCVKEGLSGEELDAYASAQPYSDIAAYDLGLLDDENFDWKRASWRAQAPWR